MFNCNFNRDFGMGIFYHECPLCNCITDEGDGISGICMCCCDRHDELSERTDLSDDDKAFLKRYNDIQKAAYKRVNMYDETE